MTLIGFDLNTKQIDENIFIFFGYKFKSIETFLLCNFKVNLKLLNSAFLEKGK